MNVEIETYPYNLQMYTVPSSGFIKLEELHEWCNNRLIVLKLVEQISLKNYKMSPKKCAEILINELDNRGIHDFANIIHNFRRKRRLAKNDCVSHFMLRCAFSFESAKKKWFVKQETKLFSWRLSFLDKDNMKEFIDVNRLEYSIISPEEMQEIKEDLILSSIENLHGMKFYKTYFSNVITSVKKRQIFLKDGIAYVPETKIFWLIIPAFKKMLINGFDYAQQVVLNAYGDERITEIFNTLSSSIKTRKYNHNKYGEVSVDKLDELSRTSYPLCMRLLHEALRTNHHLTNGGRVQYCLFLKGIGLNVNNAIQFWKEELIKTVGEKSFEREYKYYINHLFGMVGRRANYEPSPCFKIFNAKIGIRDNHGCPYKYMESHVLKRTLSKCGLVRPDIESIVKLSEDGHCLQACKAYYEARHFCTIDDTIDHPNAFFEYSIKQIESVNSDTEE